MIRRQFIKKPVVIEAIRYMREQNIMAVQEFFGHENGHIFIYEPNTNEYYIRTLEGDMLVSHGDWIIRGIKGEFYPCKPDIFDATYEAV